MPLQHLGPSRVLVLNELKAHPGRRYERDEPRLVELAADDYALGTLKAALWELEQGGYIQKERAGRRVCFYYPEQAMPEPESASLGRGGETVQGRARYTVTYERDEDGYVVASVPTLPGCHSQGRTLEEARRNIREAAQGYLASLRHRGEPIPREETVEQIELAV